MNKMMPVLIVTACLALVVSGGFAVWLVMDAFSTSPSRSEKSADYEAYVLRMEMDEPAVRAELNRIVCRNAADVSPADRALIAALPPEGCSVEQLLAIAHVREYLRTGGVAPGSAFHFLDDAGRKRLERFVGASPSDASVREFRKKLAVVAGRLSVLRARPDFKLSVEGEAPQLPIYELIEGSHQVLAGDPVVSAPADPRLPTFTAPEAVVVDQLERFLNDPRIRTSLPKASFASFYVGDRFLPDAKKSIAGFEELRKQSAVEANIILPDRNAAEERAELAEVFQRLDLFLTAVSELPRK